MNTTQTQTQFATVIAFIAGILAGKGVFGFDTATWTTILGAVLGLGMAVWTALATRKTALVGTVNNMPEVAGVITTHDAAGKAMADSFPEPTVAPAGSSHAIMMAKNGGPTG